MTNFEPCAAEVMRRFAGASGGHWIEVGGGVAGFAGADSPVNAVKGMDGEISREDLERAVEFFSDQGLDTVVELAPWVMDRCAADLAALGFERIGEEDVMVRRTEPVEEALEEVTDPEEWARILSLSFFGELNEMGLRLGRVMHASGLGLSVGLRENGELVAAAQVSYLAGAGLFAGDGTLPEWRGRGFQQRLIRGRLRLAWEAGVEWVHSEVVPGGGSQRNYQRCGFERLYSRVHFLKRRT